MKQKQPCIVVTLVSLFFLLGSLTAQNLNYRDVERRLTPSPVIASTLGMFGGVDVQRASGGFSKTIQLFKLNQGSLVYAPSVRYYSAGVKVDDWGGRVGMNWADNFTATISRTVNSVPDEAATDHREPLHRALRTTFRYYESASRNCRAGTVRRKRHGYRRRNQ